MRMFMIGCLTLAVLASGCAQAPMAPPAMRTGSQAVRAAEKLPAASPYRGLAIRTVADDKEPAASPWDRGRAIKFYMVEAGNETLTVTLRIKLYSYNHATVAKSDLSFADEAGEAAHKAYYERASRTAEYRELGLALQSAMRKLEDADQRAIMKAAVESLLKPAN